MKIAPFKYGLMVEERSYSNHQLTDGRLLARNTIFNLIGQGAPIIAAVFAIPILVKGLGTDRFGVLTLTWVAIGYFSLFDLGFSRALTKLVSEKLGESRYKELLALIWTSMFLMVILGLIGTLIVCLLSSWLVQEILKIPDFLQQETLKSFFLLAISIPVVTSTAGLRGILEAFQRFELINAIQIPMGLFTFLGPLMVLSFSRSLFPAVAVLVAGRVIACAVHVQLCLHIMPALRTNIALKKGVIKPLVSFGGWMTITNVVGPLMTYLDRFLIGALVSVTAVAYYATPYDIVTKLSHIPGALVGVLFPAFSTSFVQDPYRTALLFKRGVKYAFLAIFPILLIIMTFAYEGLNLWLGGEFAQQGTRVLQWLAVGVFFNSLTLIPFALVQGVGRPDLTAKLHFIELPFYLVIAWWLIINRGIEGAAIAWVARVAVDTFFLFGMAYRILPNLPGVLLRMTLIMGGGLFIMGLASLTAGLAMKGIFIFITLCVFGMVTWFGFLTPEERVFIKKGFKYINCRSIS